MTLTEEGVGEGFLATGRMGQLGRRGGTRESRGRKASCEVHLSAVRIRQSRLASWRSRLDTGPHFTLIFFIKKLIMVRYVSSTFTTSHF